MSRFFRPVASTKSLEKTVSSALADSEKERGFVFRLPSEFFSMVANAVSSKSRLIDASTVSPSMPVPDARSESSIPQYGLFLLHCRWKQHSL